MRSIFAVLPMTFIIACGSTEAPPEPKPTPAKHVEPAPKPEPEPEPNVVTDDGTTATIALEANDAMEYNTKRIVVHAGRKVKLTLTHTGKMNSSVMGHNFVLLKAGSDGQAFSTGSAGARDNNYISPELEEQVIAHTKLIGGGESDTIEFEAPEPGEYPFLCSYPGHYVLMSGVFVVE